MNLPNKISILRICFIPLVIFFYLAEFIPYGRLVSFLLFVIAACTDFIDGMIARKTNQVTDLGKFLDPIADKCLIMAVMILAISAPIKGGAAVLSSSPNFAGIIGIVGVILILSREFIVSAFRMIAASKNLVLKADKWGKIKTFFQDIALGGYMLYAFLISEFTLSKTFCGVFGILLLTLFIISVILTFTSGVGYIMKNKNVLKDTKDED